MQGGSCLPAPSPTSGVLDQARADGTLRYFNYTDCSSKALRKVQFRPPGFGSGQRARRDVFVGGDRTSNRRRRTLQCWRGLGAAMFHPGPGIQGRGRDPGMPCLLGWGLTPPSVDVHVRRRGGGAEGGGIKKQMGKEKEEGKGGRKDGTIEGQKDGPETREA